MSISQIIPGLASAPSIAANPIEVGSGGPKIVDNSGVFEFKNQAENALVKIRILDGAASTDGITYAQWLASVGTTSAAFQLLTGSNGCSIRTGAGAPESSVTGSVGDAYLRNNGGADTCLYLKESGAATNTGWKPYASVAYADALVGTSATIWQLDTGNTGPKLVNNSNVLEITNNAENALLKIRFLDGAAATDGVTYAQLIALSGTSASSFQIDNDSSGCSIHTVAGSPESVVTGSVGDICLRDDGSADTCFYVKESGAATNTGWKPYASVAFASALSGTSAGTWQLDDDNTGPKLKNNSGILEIKNDADNAFLKIRFLDGVAATDGVTYAQLIALAGTSATSFQIDNDNTGPNLKNNGGVLQVRNAADSAFVTVEVDTPTTSGHATTKGYVDAADAYAIRSICVPIADPAGAYTSSDTIPAGSTIVRYDVKYSEVFNNTPTLTIGYTGVLNAFSDTGDTNLTSTTFQSTNVNLPGDAGTARAVICTVGGTPDQGAANVYVYYMTTIGT